MVTVLTSSGLRFVFGFIVGLLWARYVLRLTWREVMPVAFFGALLGVAAFNFITYYK